MVLFRMFDSFFRESDAIAHGFRGRLPKLPESAPTGLHFPARRNREDRPLPSLFFHSE